MQNETKQHMSIGKWIVVAFILFAAFIGTLVTVCVKQEISLVSKDYYKEELAYEDHLKRVSNTNLSDVSPALTFGPDTLLVAFPKGTSIQRGHVAVFCPSDANLDQAFELIPGDENQSFRMTTITGRMFRVKVWWTMEDSDYYVEKQIFI